MGWGRDMQRPAPDPLPRKELFHLWVIHTSQGFQVTMLFPMIVFMVQDFGAASHDPTAVGRYAGFLACLFPFAQFCTSIMWGAISDRVGRKPVLFTGNLASLIAAIYLGLTRDYKTACLVRLISGLLNGVITVTKVILGEICNSSNQAQAFAVLPLAWGLGTILGSVVGGMAARPCQQYNISNCPPLLMKYPYLLPCSIAGLVASFALLSSVLIRETKWKDKTMYQEVQMDDFEGGKEGEMEGGDVYARLSSLRRPVAYPNHEGQLLVETAQWESSTASEHSKLAAETLGTRPGTLGTGPEHRFGATDLSDQEKLLLLEDSPDNRTPEIPYWRDRNVLLTSSLFALVALTYILHDELFPIYGASPSSVGGLDLSSSAIGVLGGGAGVFLLVLTGVFIRLNPASSLKCLRYGCMVGIPAGMVFPLASLFPHSQLLKWAMLVSGTIMKVIAACISFNGSLVLVSNSASPENMGGVTGLSHSFASFMRGVGPALGGVVWSFSAGLQIPLHQFLAWAFVTLLAALTLSISYLVTYDLDIPKVERRKRQMSSSRQAERYDIEL